MDVGLGGIVGVAAVVGLAVKQQVVYAGVVVLDVEQRLGHSLAAADDQRRAALGGFTQGGFGRLHRGIGGSVVLGRVAVGAGKSLDALPQQGVGAVVQAGLLGRQGDGCPAGQGGRLAVFVNRGREGIGTVVHRHRKGHRLAAGLAAAGAQAYRQRQGQDQRNEFFHGIRETP